MIDNDIVNNRIELKIELCNWMQENYSNDQPEMLDGKVIFSGTSNYHHEPDALDFDDVEIQF